ncbi:MAG: Ni hydr CYTB protein [Gammaproteobacteria bacterium]|nr:Ni hydr CYTB protein [Gammaproteobacteria bacterium]
MVAASKENFIVNDKSAVLAPDKLIRHVRLARLLHWLMAICVLVLLTTSLLPIAEIKFSWVTLHWVTGLILAVTALTHILWSLFRTRIRQMVFGLRDMQDAVRTLLWFFRISGQEPAKPGKYSPAQKLIHHGFAVTILASIVTGLLMMVKVDTPLWERNPYWLSNASWGIIYIIHDLASMLLVTMIMLHIYFAFRPEKRLYLRSMVLGWISRSEYASHHDPTRWENK